MTVLNRPLRVLLVTEDFPPMVGGIATYLSHLAQAPCAEMRVLAPAMPGDQEADRTLGVPVERFTLPSRRGFWTLYRKVVRYARRHQPDIILWGHLTPASSVGLLASRRTGVPFGVMVHGTDVSLVPGLFSPLRRMALLSLRHADLLIANSAYMARRTRGLGRTTKATVTINPGVDSALFQPGVMEDGLRERLGLEGKHVLLSAARLAPVKNLHLAVRAMPRILTEVPDARYLIVGEGPEKDRLQSLAHEIGVEEAVLFHSTVHHESLPAFLCLTDVFLMPSLEGFGIAAVEAAACGVPVVGIEWGGLLDAVVDQQTGLLVEQDSAEALAEAVTALLQDGQRARRMGRAGRARVEERFAWERVQEAFCRSVAAALGNAARCPARHSAVSGVEGRKDA